MKGIMLMAYGGPTSLDQVEAYLTHIRGGRKPSPDQLEDLVGRYRAIGGSSPLLEITKRQASGLEEALSRPGNAVKVYAGMKHSPPFIGDVFGQAVKDGITELLCIPLAPHYSAISIGGYEKAVSEANAALGSPVRVTFVRSWHRNPKLIAMWAGRVRKAATAAGPGASLVFSAHSLPERILREGDPYKDQLLETSGLIAKEAGWKDRSFTFQSQSNTGEPWLGPDIVDHLQSLYEGGAKGFIVAPIGFVSDHLEILFDIDVECLNWARERGVRLVRCESPNDSAEMVGALRLIASENGFA